MWVNGVMRRNTGVGPIIRHCPRPVNWPAGSQAGQWHLLTGCGTGGKRRRQSEATHCCPVRRLWIGHCSLLRRRERRLDGASPYQWPLGWEDLSRSIGKELLRLTAGLP